MKNILFCVILCLLPAFSGPLHGQSAVLNAYIQEGLDNNLALRQQNLDIRHSMEAIRQAKGLFYPTLSFTANYTLAAGGRRIELPIGNLLNPVYSTLNQLTLSDAFPQVENVSEQFLPNNFQETKLKFSVPVYNAGLRYNRRIQEQLTESKTAQKNAYENELRYQITGAYLQYLQAQEAQKIWLNAQTVLRELKRFNESLVRNNVATRDIVATAEYELSKTDMELATLRAAENTARAYFNFLLNKDLQSPVSIDTLLLNRSLPAYNQADLIAGAPQRRQEFAALRAGIEASATAVQLNESAVRLPNAYFGGEAGFQGFGYNFFDGKQAFVLAQVGVNYELYNGGQRKSKIQQAKLERERLGVQFLEAEQQVILQVTKAWNDFEAAQSAWINAREGKKAAEAVFAIVQNKYKAQQALLLEYLDAQNRVTTAQLQVLLSWMDVLAKEAELKKAAGLDN